LSKTKARSNQGTETFTLAVAFSDFADVQELRGRERYEASQLTDVADIRVKIRWRGDVDNEMKIVYNSRRYDIYSMEEMGRQEALIIFAKLIETT